VLGTNLARPLGVAALDTLHHLGRTGGRQPGLAKRTLPFACELQATPAHSHGPGYATARYCPTAAVSRERWLAHLDAPAHIDFLESDTEWPLECHLVHPLWQNEILWKRDLREAGVVNVRRGPTEGCSSDARASAQKGWCVSAPYPPPGIRRPTLQSQHRSCRQNPCAHRRSGGGRGWPWARAARPRCQRAERRPNLSTLRFSERSFYEYNTSFVLKSSLSSWGLKPDVWARTQPLAKTWELGDQEYCWIIHKCHCSPRTNRLAAGCASIRVK